MKRASSSVAIRELAAIRSSFLKIRILNHASRAPVTVTALRQLSAVANPAQILFRMTSSGLLRANAATANEAQRGRQYSLTPKGRAYSMTENQLHQLAASLLNHDQ